MKTTDLVGIGEAAEMLGLSRTSMQKLVDAGHVAAIKTAGGHRRIQRSSLQALQEKMEVGQPAAGGEARRPSVFGELAAERERAREITLLIVEDDEVVLAAIERVVQRQCPEIRCVVARDGLEAVLQIERTRPQVVITDLSMEPFDGFRLLSLLASKAEYRSIAAVALTSMSDAEIAQRGGLPPQVLLMRKPLPLERLLGYLQAQCQMLWRFSGT